MKLALTVVQLICRAILEDQILPRSFFGLFVLGFAFAVNMSQLLADD
jgi:hypothetical protein